MSLFEVLITGPGYLLAFGIIGCPLMWIAEKIDRPRAEGVAIVALFALTAVVVWPLRTPETRAFNAVVNLAPLGSWV